jgi:hypothetical protein
MKIGIGVFFEENDQIEIFKSKDLKRLHGMLDQLRFGASIFGGKINYYNLMDNGNVFDNQGNLVEDHLVKLKMKTATIVDLDSKQ